METLRKHKVFLIDTLLMDASNILNFAQQKNILTTREYNNLNHSNHTQEKIVTNLLDIVMNKGNETCLRFEKLLHCQDLQKNFPKLREHFLPPSQPLDTAAVEEEKNFYPMNHRPLGYCLIINNYDFHGTSFGNRKGTDMDRDTLTRVFKRMNFLVEERRDLPSEKIKDAVREFSENKHSEMDAFVCCILSHGEKGSVCGVDGVTVSIRDLTEPFALCRTLMGKPKLFFIQACQGDELQKGVWMGDGGSEDKQMYVDDAQISGLNSIPIKADFLIGMSTVEYYKSFRHPTEGSIYIQELCKQLEIGCPRNEDILSILTKVNASVSTKVLSGHKQMPEPKYTLTKKLVLPMD
ncbi:caspase 8, apoptosis-related cysteine peptidase, like 1 [Trichomycterus rosablanca]|uniref:caspase 8, apoptosis-related cysteine peptidase, like 1 n=1 Tax=Trichomycterus rosablanca TaxID=2290929 RepID=UPI002F35D502